MTLGFIYFIEREPGDYVKIGWAKHGPHVRISELQTGCPDLLIVRGYFPGTREDESRMHRTFADLRARGEWFCNILKLADFMRYIDGYTEGTRPLTEHELVNSLHDCVLTGHWHPEYPVKEKTYDESGDWRPWADLLGNHGLLGEEP